MNGLIVHSALLFEGWPDVPSLVDRGVGPETVGWESAAVGLPVAFPV